MPWRGPASSSAAAAAAAASSDTEAWEKDGWTMVQRSGRQVWRQAWGGGAAGAAAPQSPSAADRQKRNEGRDERKSSRNPLPEWECPRCSKRNFLNRTDCRRCAALPTAAPAATRPPTAITEKPAAQTADEVKLAGAIQAVVMARKAGFSEDALALLETEAQTIRAEVASRRVEKPLGGRLDAARAKVRRAEAYVGKVRSTLETTRAKLQELETELQQAELGQQTAQKEMDDFMKALPLTAPAEQSATSALERAVNAFTEAWSLGGFSSSDEEFENEAVKKGAPEGLAKAIAASRSLLPQPATDDEAAAKRPAVATQLDPPEAMDVDGARGALRRAGIPEEGLTEEAVRQLVVDMDAAAKRQRVS